MTAAVQQAESTIQADLPLPRENRRPPLGRLLLPSAIVALFATLAYSYVQAFGFRTGLDATSAQFGRYWYGLLAVQFVFVVLPVLFWLRWLAGSRCTTCDTQRRAEGQIEAQHELRHIWTHFSLLLAGGLSSILMPTLSLHDMAWHQAVLRDTALSPTHIPAFFGLAPLALGFITGAYIYGRTRLPAIWASQQSVPLAYVLTGIAGVVTMLFYGLNEFAHTQWVPEERVSTPFHWPFVIAFWGQIALISVVLSSLPRVAELLSNSPRPEEAGGTQPAR